MALQFVITNPPARKVGSGGKAMSKAKSIAKRVAPRAKKFMGLSVPIAETALVTSAGMFGANVAAGMATKFAVENNWAWAQSWLFRVGFKVVFGVVAGYVVRKVPRVGQRWADRIVGGALAAAALSTAKQFLPTTYETYWGLAGDAAGDMIDGMAPMLSGDVATSGIANRLAQLELT